jgi:hypothetical protein
MYIVTTDMLLLTVTQTSPLVREGASHGENLNLSNSNCHLVMGPDDVQPEEED